MQTIEKVQIHEGACGACHKWNLITERRLMRDQILNIYSYFDFCYKCARDNVTWE